MSVAQSSITVASTFKITHSETNIHALVFDPLNWTYNSPSLSGHSTEATLSNL